MEGKIMMALSLRQPLPYAILAGRLALAPVKGLWTYRGPLLLHAGKACVDNCDTVPGGWEALGRLLLRATGVTIPPLASLPRGGFVGVAHVTGCAEGVASAWFPGNMALRLEGAVALPFVEARGQRGLWECEDDGICKRAEAALRG
jgi:hypothetical protein